MCTLSWKPLKAGYILYFNRDELRNRPVAIAPLLHNNKQSAYLAPTDTQKGGTWLLVNQYGISIGLLNNYAAMDSNTLQDRAYTSRGMLPLAGADCQDIESVIKIVKAMDLEQYPAFHLLAMSTEQATMLSWDGRGFASRSLNPFGEMITSSAYQAESIARSRSDLFAGMVGEMANAELDQLEAFHWHRSEDSARGICMQRPDACTHSISRIHVCPPQKLIYYRYTPLAEVEPGAVEQTHSMALLEGRG